MLRNNQSGIGQAILILVRAAALALVASGTLHAAVLTVANTADSGPGSLRQAIADAAPGDTVAANVTGTINLGSTLNIAKNLTINGPGAANLTLDGGGAVQLFQIAGPVNLTLQNLTLAHGAAIGGGALLDNIASTTSIVGCVFSNNLALGFGGAILAIGTTTIADSTFSGNTAPMGFAGAIYAIGGTIAISNTLFGGNSSGAGGAIANGAAMTLTNVTMSGNSATANGGGILSSAASTLDIVGSTIADNTAGQGGGIEIANSGTVTIRNSTLSGNLATTVSGGGIDNYGALTLQNSTLSGNSAVSGGGIYSAASATLNLSNTLIANSTSGGDCANSGTINTNDHNLIEDGSCSPAVSGDPKLGPLANNGGSTQTQALLQGSPAIDTGNNATCLATDQRGISRPQNGICDIGAYETTGAAAVPSLSEWGMALLALLLIVFGLRSRRV